MKIELQISDDNESTDSPYWLILDPRQMMSPHHHKLASMITGPFFSRASAERELKNKRYAYGKDAIVYCHSGHWSPEYKDAIRGAK